MHNFERLVFWQKSIGFAKKIYLTSQNIASDEKFGLISQMKRAVVSIPSNIAEGSGRNSDREFNHFLAISLGSAFEIQTQLILAKELELLNAETANELLNEVSEIQRMIYSFKNNLQLKS
ncbi:four helix bundle protein [Marnyiella aurantia]|uniref:Four helix bundle protein n=1 Tax=Marnyiella aurantia TaxID=2758037 RepID=A0A7D7LN77_9FLAO|nr:four helix bundle protein [Marnyiella aurantia]MBA5247302.1 four helix bundle protein [Marnyiella aurantia]QMS99064.1 four helix bundle protein [Marnyiella aurantia]